MNRKGFTLVELLIVIALLGALAIGLIGALDPFEQLKKGQDTGTRDLVNQVQTAIIRYYSIKNNMPWCPNGGCDATSDPSSSSLSDAIMPAALSNMIDAGELKANFNELNSGNLGKVFVTGSQPDAATNRSAKAIVCYQPESKSFRNDPNTKYTIDGGLGTSCSGTNPCYWCVQ